jgi:tRNA (Thr-GGU) A37 N-methylase
MAVYRRLNQGRPVGISQSIVTTLKESNHSLSIDYLASLHGRRVVDIQPYVNKLNEKGIVIVKPLQGRSYVSLAKPPKQE